jgi:hypothetical protein
MVRVIVILPGPDVWSVDPGRVGSDMPNEIDAIGIPLG